MARDAARLIAADVEPAEVLGYAARFDARRAEYGSTHALALATDLLAFTDRRPGLDAVHPIVFALDMAAESNVRRPERERPEPADLGSADKLDPVALGTRLAELVETEDAPAAEALLAGALAAGLVRADIEPWFWRLVEAHFLDFGHAAIYVRKAFDLLERIGWQHADELLGALLFRIINGTREDTLPPWAAFKKRWSELGPELPELWSRAGSVPNWEPRGLFEAALGRPGQGSGEELFDVLVRELRRGVDPTDLALTLAAAAGERLVRFDPSHDRSIECQDGWLFVTHTLTFANAIRFGLARHPVPAALNLVGFAARFVHGMRALDQADPKPVRAAPVTEATVAGVLAAIAARDPRAAMARGAGVLAAAGADQLEQAVRDATLADGLVRPIIATHAIKTAVAAFEEHRALAEARNPGLRALADRPVLGLLHFLSAGVTERSRARIAHEAVQFVGHGKIPKILSS